MDHQKWLRIKEIFQQAIDLPVTERDAYIDTACREDDEVKAYVQKMIEADRHADEFMEKPFTLASIIHETGFIHDERIGTQIGGYTITNLLGQGGM